MKKVITLYFSKIEEPDDSHWIHVAVSGGKSMNHAIKIEEHQSLAQSVSSTVSTMLSEANPSISRDENLQEIKLVFNNEYGGKGYANYIDTRNNRKLFNDINKLNFEVPFLHKEMSLISQGVRNARSVYR